MRVRYIKSADLGVIESTVNLLLSQGWDRDSGLIFTNDGEYLMTMCHQDRLPRGSARAADIWQESLPRAGMPYPSRPPEPSQRTSVPDFTAHGSELGGSE